MKQFRNVSTMYFFVMMAMFSLPSLLHAQPQEKPNRDNTLDFLIGEWVGVGSTNTMEGEGWFSFTKDLQGAVIVRKNHADFPAANGRPASAHDDLMIIYHTPNKEIKADYYDNEGHVIRYSVTNSVDKNSLVFLSDKVPQTPRFRLTYQRHGENLVSLLFEMATPDKPDEFVKYIEANAHRK